MAAFVWGKNGEKLTPEDVERQRLASAMMYKQGADFSPAGHWSEALGRAFNGWASGRLNKIAGKGEEAGLASADEAIAALLAGRGGAGYAAPSFTASSSGAPAPAAAPQGPEYPIGVDALPQSPTTPGGYSLGTEIPAGVDPAIAARYAIPEDVKNGIFAGESGGDYDALFGFQNRPGGKFQNVKLTDMTVDQALQFAAPSGEYGQTVKGQIGRVATPMGAYQIVGTTLKAAKDGLGLTGNEVMTPELQDALGGWILANQGTGAWEGYKGPRDGYTPASGGAVTMSTSGTGGGYGGGGTGGVDIASLLALQKNPWVAKKYGGVVDALMGQQFARENAMWEAQQRQNDPMYQAQLAELTAPKPVDPFAGTKEIGGVLYGPDGQGGFVPLITPPSDGAVPLTDPAERAKWGIPPTDTRPYAVKPGEVPKVVGGDGVTVNNNMGGGPELGKLSTDYGYVLDESGQPRIDPATGLPTAAPVPGSPAAIEAARLKTTAAATEANKLTATDVITGAASAAREAAGKRKVGGILGPIAALNPGSQNAEIYRQVEVLKANASAENIAAMRAASPTGAALGGVSDKDLILLASKSGALDPASPNFERDLDDYERTVLRLVHGVEAGDRIFNETRDPTRTGVAAPVAITSDAEYDALAPGTIFVGPDGKTRVKQ